MTSGVRDVKLSRDRESQHDKLANKGASECFCVTSAPWLRRAGVLGSVNRMAAPS
jgi:hypothetical protein